MVSARLYEKLVPHYHRIKEVYLTIRQENAFLRKAGFNAWWNDFSSLEEALENGRIQSQLKSQKKENLAHYLIAKVISLPETCYSANYSFWNLEALLR